MSDVRQSTMKCNAPLRGRERGFCERPAGPTGRCPQHIPADPVERKRLRMEKFAADEARAEAASKARAKAKRERAELEAAREVIYLMRRGYAMGDTVMDVKLAEFAQASGGLYDPRHEIPRVGDVYAGAGEDESIVERVYVSVQMWLIGGVSPIDRYTIPLEELRAKKWTFVRRGGA